MAEDLRALRRALEDEFGVVLAEDLPAETLPDAVLTQVQMIQTALAGPEPRPDLERLARQLVLRRFQELLGQDVEPWLDHPIRLRRRTWLRLQDQWPDFPDLVRPRRIDAITVLAPVAVTGALLSQAGLSAWWPSAGLGLVLFVLLRVLSLRFKRLVPRQFRTWNDLVDHLMHEAGDRWKVASAWTDANMARDRIGEILAGHIPETDTEGIHAG